jgi:hypothetical protein
VGVNSPNANDEQETPNTKYLMATVQPTRAKPTDRLAERDPQVYHPLDRLRGIIRRYVVIEGLLSAALFLALWFTLGLALDYGMFKTLGWDWVRDGARWVRGLALAVALGLFAAILVFRIVRRLTKEFSYPALALVLERRFPKVLGDRLITAVEMADVEAMGKFGYSTDMLRATIAEARERVGKVPVNEVFNWRRLWVLGFLAVGLLVATVAFSFASYAVATNSADPVRFGWKFAHVAGIFAERNVALMNTPWPRRAHLELVGFPAGGELTVGRDAPPPRVTARAYRWVIADRDTPDGWRPLVWSDLTPEFVGRAVPPLPPAVRAATSAEGDPTADTVERLAHETDDEVPPDVAKARALIREQMNSRVEDDPDHPGSKRTATTHDYEELQEVFKALAEKADRPSMGRTLRRLDLPPEVTYKFSGKRSGGSGTLTPQQNNEFAGEIGGLKEDVEFVVRGADYMSVPRRIRLIPPPTLRRLGRDQSEPAYLHHAPPQGEGYDALAGRLQKVAAKDLSLTGDRTVFVVPAGTELTLSGEAYVADDNTIPDTDRIVSAHAIPVAGRFPGTVYDAEAKPTQTPVPLKLAADGAGFSVAFGETRKLPRRLAAGGDFVSGCAANAVAAARKYTDFRLTENVEFKVVFTNKYNVSATRTFLIQVVQDQPPTVEVAVDTVRKSGSFYLVTPKARIPFNPDSFVKDDHGLSKVEYTFSYFAEDSDVVRTIRAKYALRSLLDVPLPGGGPAVLLPRLHADNFRLLDKADDRLNASVFVSEFSNQDRQLRRDTREQFEALLRQPKAEEAAPQAVRKIELKQPDRDYFDLKELHDLGVLKIAARETDVQTIYRMDLNVQATDNNVDADGGPKVVRNVEPIRLRIISEGDLLLEIGREEDQLAARLDEALLKLAAVKKGYEFVRSNNGFKEETPQQVDTVKVRSQGALMEMEKARDIVQSVGREYRRLTRECQINRVNEAAQKRYNEFTDILDGVVSEAPQIPVTFPKTQALMQAVHAPLNTGHWAPLVAVADAENSIYALERRVQEIRLMIGEAQSKERLKKKLLEIKEHQARIRNEIQKMYDDWLRRVSSKDPFIGEAGVVSLTKGESRKVSHTIEWRQYEGPKGKEDELPVKLTSSDPSLMVPPELTLTFEKHQFRFEYEIKAGNKEGTFKVKVAPAVGAPVEVTVIVK